MAYGIYEHRYSAVPDGGHSIRITQIQADPNDSEQLALARRLTYELVSQLTSHKRFLVYAPELSSALLSDSGNAEPDYVLSGFARSVSTTTRVTVLLTDMRSEHAIWATNLDADLTTARAFEFQIRASEAIIDAILNQVDPARTADPEHALRLETAAIGKPR
jgi:TolB-like protein